ncbi:efflux RND transporter periplasmic adaptor subunit [Paracrocinitomix mangrovi]|uniref:efflux RND transporter periplasmic adaptor subunit n=1 Tax=Paracrocinitomix mangrovi TaxID=2862509 RepID=UPI001C8DDF43|nr:efflux RND transporter periplasmic adaptor subunit [Paracrocinitomix mangrovi]UKN02168.1 efflux RND transporter periplasmic adaptor subunit [Paracrocinitomix mangrovi]
MKRKRIVKSIVWSIVALLALVLIYFQFIRKPDPIINFKLETIQNEALYYEVSATGTILPEKSVDVGTQVSGQISEIYVDVNDEVKKGQLLAKMDTRSMVISLKESQSNYERSKLAVEQTKRTYELEKKLFEQGASYEVALNKAKDAYESAVIALDLAKVQQQKIKLNLGYAEIVSPIDGVVISVNVNVGQTVAATFTSPTLFSIVNDLTKMKIEASVDEADVGKVKRGQEVKFTVDAYPEEEFMGVVEEVQIQPIVVQGVVTYKTIILIDNPDQKLLPGMTATLLIKTDEHPVSKTIPNAALSFDPNNLDWKILKKQGYKMTAVESDSVESIWVLKNKMFSEIPVSVAYTNGIRSAIEGEVTEQDSVITYCRIQLSEDENEGLFNGN